MKTTLNQSGNPRPTANITVNKNRVKLYDDHYYLQDGQTFEIELFNPTKDKVRADIFLDGGLISAGGLVLKPGERIFLERFIDSNNKFLFETYEVEDSEEANEAISNNGKLKVEFYRETTQLRYSTDWINYGFDPSKHPLYPKVTYLDGGGYGIPSTGTLPNITFTTTSTDSGYIIGVDAGNISDTSVICNYNSSTGGMEYLFDEANTDSTNETGRTEKGEESEQSFSSTLGSFDFLPFETVEYKILPVSKKPITKKDVVYQRYCHECGSKIKSKFKFCPTCGEKL